MLEAGCAIEGGVNLGRRSGGRPHADSHLGASMTEYVVPAVNVGNLGSVSGPRMPMAKLVTRCNARLAKLGAAAAGGVPAAPTWVVPRRAGRPHEVAPIWWTPSLWCFGLVAVKQFVLSRAAIVDRRVASTEIVEALDVLEDDASCLGAGSKVHLVREFVPARAPEATVRGGSDKGCSVNYFSLSGLSTLENATLTRWASIESAGALAHGIMHLATEALHRKAR